MQGPRERMVVSAALLIRERGAHATAISDVLQHSGAPRGSAYHYFPGGRTQLLCEAVDYAGEHVAAMINEAEGGLELLDALIDKYRQQLLSTDFRAGCPIAAVSVEAGDEQDRERMAPVIARAAAVFDRWSDLTCPAVHCRRHTAGSGARAGGVGDVDARGRNLAGSGAARPDAAGSGSPPAAQPAAGRAARKEPMMTSSDWLPTACILCECNCGIVVQVDDRRLARIRGDKAHPGSAGYTCNKALRLDHYQNNRARLSSPMRRRADGTYEEIDWDTAIVEIAEGFKQIRDTHGGDKIFYYGGGGQGNHLGGAYSGAFLKALGSRYRSNALAQEKTGEAWVDFQLYGGHTRGEFENAEVSVFVGKNPWMSQSFPRARVVLNEIAKDPGRSMIVIDPVVTDTAKMADFHLRVQPGCDAWCLAALAAVLVQENLCNEAFLAAHVHGVDTVRAALQEVPVADYAQRCGVDEELLRAAARRIGTAASVSVFEDLGIQQAPNSTVCSYLNKLLWILTGNFAKKGGQHLHSSFAPLFSQVSGRTPVTGAPIIAGLIPGNVVPEEILTEHPDRFRAMIVERGNPAHSLADSAACRAAFQALELMVVVDVAMTETARLAHYVLPAASQFEKPEATFFNFEFPRNGFQLRRPLFPPLPGTLPEPEIWARLVRALGVVDEADLRPLREAAAQGRQAYTEAFLAAAATNPTVAKLTAYVLYETLGPTLPDGLAGAAALWGLAQKTAMAYPDAVRRAGHADGNALFDAILERPSGVTFTVHNYEDDFALISHPDHKIALEIPEMLAEIRSLTQTPSRLTTPQLPIVLSVGERRAYTANDIFRDPSWRKRDANGALRVSVEDAQALGLADGCLARITTAAGSAEATVEVTETMLAGHAALPNGFGLDYTGDDGRTVVAGVAPNALTSTRWRDPYAGTPWHKHVPAAIRRADAESPIW